MIGWWVMMGDGELGITVLCDLGIYHSLVWISCLVR